MRALMTPKSCAVGMRNAILSSNLKLAQLTSSESKNSFEFLTQNEVSLANFNTYKIIFNWQPFMNRVYMSRSFSLGALQSKRSSILTLLPRQR